MKKLSSLTFLFILTLIISCSKTINIDNTILPPEDKVSSFNSKTIAVLPFQNQTNNKELSKIVRISFYSHLTVRAFKDIELGEVDNSLKSLKISQISINNKKLIKKFGNYIGADYLVFGSVNANKKLYAAVYSLNSIEIAIYIVDTESGKIVWNDTIISKQHEGGIPTSILSVPFISVTTTTNMDKDITFILIEDACRLLAYRIPKELISDNQKKGKYYLQAGAFLSKEIAIEFLNKLRKNGFPVFLKKEDNWFKVLLGPYESFEEVTYQKDKIKEKLHINSLIKNN